MASLADVASSMKTVQINLFKFVCPMTMAIGTISCIINLLIFAQKTLRKNPCSIYFIAYNVANVFYIYALYLSVTLIFGYHIDESVHHMFICRLVLYLNFVFNCLSPFYLIMASVDRVLITSANARTRQRSTIRFAYLSILVGTLFWSIFHIHAIVFASHELYATNDTLCYFQSGVYYSLVGYYQLLKGIVAVSLMILFGLWAIKNVRNVGRPRVSLDTQGTQAGTGNHTHSVQSKDRLLTRLVLLDTIIYILFSLPCTIFLLYGQITYFNANKSSEQVEIEGYVSRFCLYLLGIPYCTSFYANLLVSKRFRKEVGKVLTLKRLLGTESI